MKRHRYFQEVPRYSEVLGDSHGSHDIHWQTVGKLVVDQHIRQPVKATCGAIVSQGMTA